MDAALAELLQCPRCAGPLRVPNAAGKPIECRECQVDFPDAAGIPCLFPEPSKTLGDWRRDIQRLVELVGHQVDSFDRELKRTDLLASTRQRLEQLRAAYRDNGNRIIELFKAAGLGPDARAKASDRDHSLLLYYEQCLRDWAWEAEGGTRENELAVDLVAATLGEDRTLGRMLVLGTGPSRLAYDLHRRFGATLTVGLDVDLLLLLVAQRVLFGGGMTLAEFPSDSPTLASVSVDHVLAAPAPLPTGFHLIAADAFKAPLRPGSFDTIVTPWFIDIVPIDLRETISTVHRLLAPGGRWINYGPLSYPQELRHGQRYTPDELVELARAGGFELPGLTRTVMDYMRSRANGRWKTVEVFTFAARKIEATVAASAGPPAGAPPVWVMFSHLPVPRFAGLDEWTPDHPLLGYLRSLIDGNRTLADMTARMIADHGARPDAALEGTRAMLALLWNSVQESKTQRAV